MRRSGGCPRPSVAALDSVPSSVAEEAEDSPGSGCGGDEGGDGDGASFSFQYARGGFVALETTPKFGSFNPPGETELAGLDLKPAAAGHEADPECSTEADDEVPAASVPGAEAKDERARNYGAARLMARSRHELCLGFDQPRKLPVDC